MGIKLDFTSTENNEYGVLPEGWYDCTISNADVKISPTSGGKYVAWTFKVFEPPEYKNRKLFLNTSLQPQALWKLKELLNAVGINVNGVYEFDPDDIIGSIVKVYAIESNYRGKDVNKVDQILPSGTKLLEIEEIVPDNFPPAPKVKTKSNKTKQAPDIDDIPF